MIKRNISEFKFINQYNLYNITENLDNTINYNYNSTIVNLIESILLNNNKLIGLDSHRKFILDFFNEADKIIDKESYNLLDKKYKDLDTYLGSI